MPVLSPKYSSTQPGILEYLSPNYSSTTAGLLQYCATVPAVQKKSPAGKRLPGMMSDCKRVVI